MFLSSIKKFVSSLVKNPEKAEIILKIKEAYFDGVKYKDKVKSVDIYTAVLENGVNNVEEFSKTTNTEVKPMYLKRVICNQNT
jgi:hypothetical protein